MESDKLKTVKAQTKILEETKKFYNAVMSVATSGVFSNIVRLIIMIAFGIGYKIFSKKLEELNIKLAAELSAKEQAELKAYLEGINQKSDDDKVIELEEGF